MQFLSNKIASHEVRPGDHIYTYRTRVNLFAHHGIYISAEKVVHFTRDTDCPVSSSLDSFLNGGNLYLYKYNVSRAKFLARPRGGTCTMASSDPPEEVIRRANVLLLHKAFGPYGIKSRNCETFSVYCKTGSLSLDRDGFIGFLNRNGFGMSGQVNAVIAAVPGLVLGLGSPVAGFSVYCVVRLYLDGAGEDSSHTTTKVSVEELLEMNKADKAD